MCGIVAYVGEKQAYPILIDGLKKLEYRGYDSSGVAIMNGSLSLLKKKGKVADLMKFAISKKTEGNIGLGHTRWATHGEPSDINSHPHQSQSGHLTLIHNGIMENYASIKKLLLDQGKYFHSSTDSEVLVQFIEWYQEKYSIDSHEALRRALQDVEGSFAIVLFDLQNPTQVLAARRQSPLAIGVGDKEFYVSSDALSISKHTDTVIYLEENVIAMLSDDGESSYIALDRTEVEPEISTVSYDKIEVSKGAFDTFMMKEIYDQSSCITELVNARIKKNVINYPELDVLSKDIDRVIITACGTSWHSGLVAEYFFEKYARLSVEVEYASEFRYKEPVLSSRDLVIGVSQSGETADTIAALEMASRSGCKTLGLVNGYNSTIARMVDEVIYLDIGAEIGVASTKAFTSQVSQFILMAIKIADQRIGLDPDFLRSFLTDVHDLPSLIDEFLQKNNTIETIAHELADKNSALFLGRGNLFPIALEGALKLKEISYIHAEGYPAGEMKHGPIALIDAEMPVIALANNDSSLPKLISNIQEVKSRKAIVVIIKNQSIDLPEGLADYVIEVPDTSELLNPILQSIPLQLLSYHVARLRECNVDQPRNLAKSVTVE